MSINRRKFLEALTIAGITLPNISFANKKIEASNSVKFDFIVPAYLQNQINNNISVFSILNKPAFAWLEILDDNNQIKSKIYQSEDGMLEANTDLFKFTIIDAPRRFKYRIVAKEVLKFEAYKIVYGEEIKSDIFSAKLAKKDQDQISCLIYNDVHETKNTYKDLVPNQNLDRYDFAILNGDSFHYVSNQNDITEKLLQPFSFFETSKPFIMNRGNHETRGSFSRIFKKYFGYPENKFYQSFKLGPIYWILLDSGEDKPDTHEVYGGTVDYDHYRKEQAVWLEQVLQSKERKSAQHTVVVSHIPIFHADDWHGTLHNRSTFHPLFQKYKIDVMITGHTHQYGYYPPDQDHNYTLFIGGGPKTGERTVIDVHGDKRSLDIKMIKDNGDIVGHLKK
ncbi:metallophosphoesterase family protein [Sphingobacterium faecium]|uniref:metallophosphoesterase family protein n=1 Tax=Sphingobacterium faecium TaxID=34087 RepID=UPI00320849A3